MGKFECLIVNGSLLAKIHVPFCTLGFLPQDIDFYSSQIFTIKGIV
jgi:hypothetical protein